MTPITSIRKAVTTLANRINRTLHNLSSAFTKAWQMIKAQRFILTKVAGVTFQNRQSAHGYVREYSDISDTIKKGNLIL